jgi:hypothetical protein
LVGLAGVEGGSGTGNLDADLLEDTEAIDLKPDFGDLVVLKAVEDDAVLGDGFVAGGKARERAGVDGGHGPVGGGLIVVGDDPFDGEVLAGERATEGLDTLGEVSEADLIACIGVVYDVGADELGKEVESVVVEALLVEAADDGGVIGHGGSLGKGWGLGWGREGDEGEQEGWDRVSVSLHKAPHIEYMNIYRIDVYTLKKWQRD